MCIPNDPNELDALYAEAARMDRVIEALFPRSPRAGARPTRTPSLPAAGAGNADIRQDIPLEEIPADIIEAALNVERFFRSRNITGWKLAGCMDRYPYESARAHRKYEFERDSDATGV